MIEVRIHGRGGQGSVVAAELMALAAFEDGKFSQAFPAFGAERRGAPVMAFVRIDEKAIRTKEYVYAPNYVIVQDATLVGSVDVVKGLRKGGIVIVNTPAESIKINGAKVLAIDATKIAKEVIGRPIVNTTLLGAFVGFTGEIKLESLIKAVRERFPGALGEKNIAAIEKVYEICRGGE